MWQDKLQVRLDGDEIVSLASQTVHARDRFDTVQAGAPRDVDDTINRLGDEVMRHLG